MNPARPTAAVLLGLLAVTLAAPAARATAEPDPVVAGERVSINDGGWCGPIRQATAASELFGAVALRPGARGMAAEVRVGQEVAPGRYQVTIECGRGGARHVDSVTVTEGRADSVGAAQVIGGLALLAVAGGAAYRLRRRGAAALG
ncbi:hypothetical protein MOV08_32340 [Streptomyces yunnanensis]|uniref:MYXO-CTERM domain-containing protein n=1 Tax=Streptomyces yunnanensis TaxID=156453 RepID=A0ABY8AES2_9ACTN|nr:hypothetical protein [Streptomyces yunnanensis]WEB43505.1 hypothetical protein MOV08_32340 [Streptomyces yunnanensis]